MSLHEKSEVLQAWDEVQRRMNKIGQDVDSEGIPLDCFTWLDLLVEQEIPSSVEQRLSNLEKIMEQQTIMLQKLCSELLKKT